MEQTFQAHLTARGPGGAWTYISIPFDVEKIFGRKSRVPVAGTINGYAFRNSLMPEGDGTHAMAVSKTMQAGAKATAGDLVTVVMNIDTIERSVELPIELSEALKANDVAALAFETLSYSHKKEYAEWVGDAKKTETRLDRARKSLDMMIARKHVR